MDPIDFRLLNSAKEGTRRATGPLLPKVGFIGTLQAAKDHPHYSAPLQVRYRGRGVASGFWIKASGPSRATASVNTDGTVNLVEGSPDIGGTRVSVSQQFVEALGIPVEAVKPHVGDTESIGFTSNTGGNGVAFKTGWACYEAALDVKRQTIQRAAKIWDTAEDDMGYVDGVLRHASDPELRLTFQQMAARQIATGGAIVGRAGVNPGGVGPTIAIHVVDLEVDPETGKVTILRYTAIQDAGISDTSQLRGGPDARWRCPGHRLGLERRVFRERTGPYAELQLPGLPNAYRLGLADDRHGHRRQSPTPVIPMVRVVSARFLSFRPWQQ